MRIEVKPELLRWALMRAGLGIGALAKRFPQFASWERGEEFPTLKQLENFANLTHTPIGYFFLQAPPVERLPIPDFRTLGSERILQPSSDLLETIYTCQGRQDWYREFMQSSGEDPLAFVGSLNTASKIDAAADRIRSTLNFDLHERHEFPSWVEALRYFIDQAESSGVLVMLNGIVGSNTHRKLDPSEFRGFALVDKQAPLVFINGADTKAAQMFTLAHELAHIWLGQSALSNAAPTSRSSNKTEKWCNQVAAELLVPLASLRNEYRQGTNLKSEANRLARRFKVSSLVILRRIYDAGYIAIEKFMSAYELELRDAMRAIEKNDGRGNFYYTHSLRVGKRFARALITSTLEGQTLYRDAFDMLGVSTLSTFQQIGRNLRVA
jgi:Zn-dependent peptidase ImmA (M78 family)